MITLDFNYKAVSILIVFCIACVAVECVIMDVSATDSSYVTYTIDNMTVPDPDVIFANNDTFLANTTLVSSGSKPERTPYRNNTRITQGQCVEIGGTYDVSGVIGFTTSLEYNAFAWYNRYEDAFDPYNNEAASYIYKMPPQRLAYYNFFIDPNIFSDRQGYWYQFNGAFERAANKRAFYVSDRCISSINDTIYVDVNNKPVLLNPRVLEPRHVADVLLANDDPLYMNVTGEFQMWMFGYADRILSRNINTTPSDVLINTTEINKWGIGTYSLLFEAVGKNTVYDVSYAINTRNTFDKDTLVPRFREYDVIDITGQQPRMIQTILETFLTKNTDDVFTKYSMELQEPYIDINGYQEIQIGNTSLLEVAGYTNKASGSFVTVYVDRDKATLTGVKYPAMTLAVENGSIGDYRTFHGYIPLYYENIAPGFHTLTAVLPSGKFAAVDFYVREEPERHYQQPFYYKFIDGNPFYEPVVVEKEVIREVLKEVPVIVKEPVDYETLAKEKNQQLYDDIRNAIPAVIGIAGGLILIIYMVSVVVRAYERRKRNTV